MIYVGILTVLMYIVPSQAKILLIFSLRPFFLHYYGIFDVDSLFSPFSSVDSKLKNFDSSSLESTYNYDYIQRFAGSMQTHAHSCW